jgi:hypothetical protein
MSKLGFCEDCEQDGPTFYHFVNDEVGELELCEECIDAHLRGGVMTMGEADG